MVSFVQKLSVAAVVLACPRISLDCLRTRIGLEWGGLGTRTMDACPLLDGVPAPRHNSQVRLHVHCECMYKCVKIVRE